ncbi:aspartate aminotransferase family protein [Echinicola jeungdonensis]|uniref:Acetylornithine aminotransferase n=1 Tax=Echinicola jeungdonensis TaxID=709343 RepID=A0ABV5J3X4_9BACT|nr:aspartate aminotransferase family protein [Echinicola jeungdonensis]MDN3670571.1 aspartate aminotransferase family protein [Echinicola jeungdonensis]
MKISNEVLHLVDKRHYLPTFNRFPLAFIRGKGSRLWDADEKEYIDMLAGIAVNNVGHCHPKVVKAIQDQAATLIHISNFFVSPSQVALSELLVRISGMNQVFLTNSGAESVEGAIKVARKYAHQNGRGGKIISMTNSFHGRTLATIATGQEKYQKGFEPIPSGFVQVPFNDLEAVEKEMEQDAAAVILEPVQGEGGIHVVDQLYLSALRNLCDERGVLLIFDEIQCGIGRTGKWFAKDHFGVQPDIMTLAKALGGGTPIGAFLCHQKVSDAIEFGDHGTTFGGNPLMASAALANLQVIEEESLCQRAAEKGEWIKDQFTGLQQKYPMIKEIRGKGLMLGIQFDREVAPMVKRLMEEGVIANATAETVLRLVPPLNIPQGDLEQVLDLIDQILSEMDA